ncbi:SRPBCC domain-containing protein [Micromonospora sp. CPCC 205556]|uniref:SRPBCC domain-containing protein n=1 Tax=Micromonospora sp. CPCC 205556 TaxID=3122398 RepID=UPI002FEEF8DF
MIEIGAQAHLSHPRDRVWRALTDPHLLARWFTETGTVTQTAGGLLLHTAGLPGFTAAVDAQVTERREPELLVLRCQEGDRRTLLTCTITPTAEGCQLTVRETTEPGTWSTEDRDRRERYYQQALTGRLPAILDWLAFQQVDLRRAVGRPTAQLPVIAPADDTRAATRRRVALIAAAAVAALAAGAAVWALLPGTPEHTAGPDPLLAPPGAVTPTSRPPRATPGSRSTRGAEPTTARPSRTRTATPPPTRTGATPATAAVTARYETTATRIFGYTGEVALDNAGATTARNWTVVLTLSDGGRVSRATGADWRQDGRSVTFTGAPVPAGRSRTFTFDVRDPDPRAKAPEGCTVGDDPCAGL